MPVKKPIKPYLDHIPAQSGQWLALLGNQTTGVGLTAEQARLASKANRGAERPQVVYVPLDQRPPLVLPELYSEVVATFPLEMAGKVWLVGGAIRNAILRRPLYRLKFVVNGDPLPLAKRTANLLDGVAHGTQVTLFLQSEDGSEWRFPLIFERMQGERILDHLLLQDFTINALAVQTDLPECLLDPTLGVPDLQRKLIRQVYNQPPESASLYIHPASSYHGVRLAAELGLHIDRHTRQTMRQVAEIVRQLPPNLLLREFLLGLLTPRPAAFLTALEMLGLHSAMLGDVKASQMGGQWERALRALDTLRGLTSVLRADHNLDAASELALGMVAGRVGRFRQQIDLHLSTHLHCMVPLASLLAYVLLSNNLQADEPRALRVDNVFRCLPKAEQHYLTDLFNAHRQLTTSGTLQTTVEQYRHLTLELCMLKLAETLCTWQYHFAQHQAEWKALLDEVVLLLGQWETAS
jgi:hypothetical protein